MSQVSQILVGRSPETLYVKVVGAATNVLGPSLYDLLAQGRSEGVRQILVDLSSCPCLDSTFAGCLVRYVSEGQGHQQPTLSIVCPTQGCGRALVQMHLEGVLNIVDEPVAAPPDLEEVPIGKLEPVPTVELFAAAHRSLAEADERNRESFGRFADALEKDLQRRRDTGRQ